MKRRAVAGLSFRPARRFAKHVGRQPDSRGGKMQSAYSPTRRAGDSCLASRPFASGNGSPSTRQLFADASSTNPAEPWTAILCSRALEQLTGRLVGRRRARCSPRAGAIGGGGRSRPGIAGSICRSMCCRLGAWPRGDVAVIAIARLGRKHAGRSSGLCAPYGFDGKRGSANRRRRTGQRNAN